MFKITQQFVSKNKPQIILILCGLIASFLCWTRVHYFVWFFGDDAVRYFDTDDFMTIVRIRDFFENFDLADNVIKRANFPYGGDMHWTRIYDFILIIPAWILNCFLDNINKSTEYIGFIVAPSIKCFFSIVLFKFLSKVFDSKTEAFCASLTILIHPAINYTNMFARPDHHAFTMLMMTLYLLFFTEAWESNFKNNICNIKVGIISALNIWTTPETLIFLIISHAVLFLYIRSDKEKLLSASLQYVYAAISISVIVVMFKPLEESTFWLVMISAAAVGLYYKNQHKLASTLLLFAIIYIYCFFPTEYDKISVVHLIFYIFMAYFFTYAAKLHSFLHQCAYGGFLGLAFLILFPQFLYGMEADISNALREAWFDTNIEEMKSPFSFSSTVVAHFVIYIVISVIVIYDKIIQLLTKPNQHMNLIWWIIVASSLCFMIFACIADRLRSTFAFFSTPLIVDFIFHGTYSKFLSRNVQIALVFIFTIGSDVTQKYYPIVHMYIVEGEKAFNEFCLNYKNTFQKMTDL